MVNKLIFISIWFVILLCVIVLIGWQFDIALFRSLIPGAPVTMPQTVTIFLCLTFALEASRRIISGRQKAYLYVLCLGFSAIAIFITIWTSIQYIFGLGSSLETFFYSKMVTAYGGRYPGRSSPQTIITGFLMAAAIGLSPFSQPRIKKYSMILGILAVIIPWFALFGYISLTNPFYLLPNSPATGMSPITAITYFCIAFGIICLRPNEGIINLIMAPSSGREIVKRLLPVAIIAPLVIGWLVIYFSASGLMNNSVGFVFSWGVTSILFAALVIWQSFVLHRQDIEREAFIQEREKMLVELEQAETKFRTIIESAPDAIVIVNEFGHIFLVNKQTEKLFGYRREELFNKSIEILIPQRYRDKHTGYREDYTASPKVRAMGIGLDLYGLKKNGEEIPIEVSLSPLEMSEGKFIASTIRDFSEQKKIASEIKTANARLNQYAKELERSNVELKQFAYVVSHDLQAPLRNISGFVQLLKRTYEGQIDEQADSWIERTVNNTKRMQTIINDILSYSRVDSRARPFENVDLNKIFDEVLIILESSISDAKAVVTKDKLPVIWGDSSQLIQIFQNIIGNGIKYNKSEFPSVHVTSKEENKHFTILISDNGIGIDSQYYERIFEIFQRLHTYKDYPGTGIGLAICRRIVERHGGEIWIESEMGKGSKFYFTIKKVSEEGV